MPWTEVRIFQYAEDDRPLTRWLAALETGEPDAYAKCLHLILCLAEHGHQLRRPMADYLRNGIYELRAKKGRIHYRILYGFQGSHVAILLLGTTKRDKVAPKDIDLAIARMALVTKDPDKHTVGYEV